MLANLAAVEAWHLLLAHSELGNHSWKGGEGQYLCWASPNASGLGRHPQKTWSTCLIKHMETERPSKGEQLASRYTAPWRPSEVEDKESSSELGTWILRPPDSVS